MQSAQVSEGVLIMSRRPLQCPFCENYLRAPVDIHFKSMDILGGICICGAIYALDRGGHNLGGIYMDALTFACRGDYDKALSLSPGEYEEETLNYDSHTNTASAREVKGKRSSRIIFVKLKAV